MRSYQVCVDQYYFREIGQKMPLGSVIELRPGDAERYMSGHPGLLKPLPVTTQARPQAVRSEPVKVPVEPENPSEPEAPAEQLVEVKEVPKEGVPAEEVKPEEPKADAPAEAAPAETPEAGKAEEKPRGKARAKKS